jgi:2-(1,2-epoxy-1,2-dihydrophenyl)acetyl-CoA isomerase
MSAVAPRLPLIPQPVIAAVNGVAAGAGLSIALASDVRVASDKARFSSIFIKRAGVPDNGASYLLPALAGMGVAAEMSLTGRIYDAQWAYRVGLVNMVVPADRLMEEAKSLAEEIASNPPLAVRATKQLLNGHVPKLQEVDRLEREANVPARDSEDRREAILSFLEKREPVYKGR